MVAVFVLLVGILAAFSLVSSALSYSSAYKLQLTAAYLAQEGIEIVRNIRDTNWVQGNTWDVLNNVLTTGSDIYNFDYRSQSIPDTANCSSGKNYLKIEGGFYKCSNNSSVTFRRKVNLTSSVADEILVTVTVEWSERGRDHTFQAQEKIYNWR